MRKKSLSLLCLSFAIACSSLVACGSTKLSEDSDALPIYVPYNEIPEVYPEEAACADGCVVMESLYPSWILYTKQFLESSRLVSGEESWEKFLMSVETGESAKLRIVYYHIDSAGEEQGYQVFDLSYEDGKYFLYSEKDGEEVTEEYAALKCFRGDYHTQEWFLLGESVLETDYKTILDVDIFSSRTVILENHVPGTPTWQLICFSDSEEEPDMRTPSLSTESTSEKDSGEGTLASSIGLSSETTEMRKKWRSV